jgi:hypothetical protein
MWRRDSEFWGDGFVARELLQTARVDRLYIRISTATGAQRFERLSIHRFLWFFGFLFFMGCLKMSVNELWMYNEIKFREDYFWLTLIIPYTPVDARIDFSKANLKDLLTTSDSGANALTIPSSNLNFNNDENGQTN